MDIFLITQSLWPSTHERVTIEAGRGMLKGGYQLNLFILQLKESHPKSVK